MNLLAMIFNDTFTQFTLNGIFFEYFMIFKIFIYYIHSIIFMFIYISLFLLVYYLLCVMTLNKISELDIRKFYGLIDLSGILFVQRSCSKGHSKMDFKGPATPKCVTHLLESRFLPFKDSNDLLSVGSLKLEGLSNYEWKI